MTYLDAARISYRQAKQAYRASDYAAAARLFNHAREMYQQDAWQYGELKSPAISIASRFLRQSIRLRDTA